MTPPPDRLRIAFLGLGTMGSGMARRLLAAGFPLTVYNRDPAKAKALADEGARRAESPREAARQADAVFTMVADDSASRSLWLGENGILAGARSGLIAVESSTVTPGWVQELAGAARAAGAELVDAPVTGSKGAAAGGELNFLVGGAATAIERLRPAFSAMGKTLVHLGPTGSGALVKLINNFVCGVEIAALAEALALIERSALNREQALEVLTGGAPGSPLFRAVAARMLKPDYSPQFALKLMAKDLTYALSEGLHRGLSLETASTALRIFQRAQDSGEGDRDISAVIEPLRKSR